MAISAALVLYSYIKICRQERSWINWYTFPVFLTLASGYLLPSIYLLVFHPDGSYFANAYCYMTYACSSLSMMFGYRMAHAAAGSTRDPKLYRYSYKLFPWILLASSVLLYLPVLIEFRDLLLTPREIYMQTRTGYGINFFGSAVMMFLAFVTYLFKKRKSYAGGCLLCGICATLIFLHGTKGEVLGLIEIFILYRVYILRRRVSVASAVASIAAMAIVGTLWFALLGGLTDFGELAVSMSAYSDYTRNAMLVIDDPKGQLYWGRLTMEDEVYSRIPRIIMPNKPKDFGGFKLASIYYPEWFQGDAGSPSFGMGEQYADFGVFAIVFISLWSALSGWVVALLIASLKQRPEPGRFLVLLFFSGVGIIPVGDGYLLPETIMLGAMLTFVYRHRFVVLNQTSTPEVLPSS
jgi:hypothetical protein